MFLSKKSIKPIGLGSFCVVRKELRSEMKTQDNYTKNNGAMWNTKFLHLADADLLYVVDNKVFDKEGLYRVVPISFHEEGYYADKATSCANNKKSFIVSMSNLSMVLGNELYGRESIITNDRLRANISTHNRTYSLFEKNIQIKWEENN